MSPWKSTLTVACLIAFACTTPKETTMNDAAATIIDDMEAAFSRHDVEGVLALFAEDATIESYMVTRVFDRKDGVCRGKAEIRKLVGALVERGTPWKGHDPPIVRGNTIAVEYKAKSSESEKFSVDIIELKDGKIHSLRAYAGWRAVMGITDGADR